MRYSAREVREHYSETKRIANQLLSQYRELKTETDGLLKRINQQKEDCTLELAHQYLSQLTKQDLDLAEQLTGFRGFSRLKPIEAMAKERQMLNKTIQVIEADERYQKRQLLAGPQGTETQKLEEYREFLQQWQADCEPFESLEGFMELLEVKYDTPEFSVPWYSSKYWKYWATGDKICEELKMKDFGDDVIPAYIKLAKERNKWSEQVNQQQQILTEIHQLIEQHDTSQARLPNLEAIYLEQCQLKLQQFLTLADPPLLEQWRERDVPEDRGLQMGLRRLSGLSAKIDFISQFQQKGIATMISSLEDRSNKYRRKIDKYGRDKHRFATFEERALDLKFIQKSDKYFKRRQKATKILHRIETYDDYDRFSLDNDPNLWWEEMTGKQPSSTFTPDLHRWYEQNDRDIIFDESYTQSAVSQAQSVQEIEDDLGYLS